MPPGGPREPAPDRSLALHGPTGLWSVCLAIPADVVGLYLALAWFHLVPTGWPAADWDGAVLLAFAIGLFVIARTIALLALGHVLHWRAASERWSRLANRDAGRP